MGLTSAGIPREVWSEALVVGADPVIAALGCVALAGGDQPIAAKLLAKVGSLARESRWPEVRHACAFAEANVVRDDELDTLAAALDAADPVLAAIAAWRRGRVSADLDVDTPLFSAVLGPAGLERDAAAAALSHRLGPKADSPPLGRPPAPSARPYAPAFERWLLSVVAPAFEPLTATQLSQSRAAISRAMAINADGSRVQRMALRKAQQPCFARSARSDPATPRPAALDRTLLCLAPLSSETMVIAPTKSD